MATAEEWELTLKRAVGAPDLTGSETAWKLQRDLVLGGYAVGDLDDSQEPIPRVRMTVKAIIQLAESGGLDDLFVDPPRTSLEVIAHRVNIDAFGEKGARAIEEAAGGAAPLLEKLRTYVPKHPSDDDPPGKDDAPST